MSTKQIPATGNIAVDTPSFADMNMGERRILSQETGVDFQTLIRLMEAADNKIIDVDGVDVTDLMYAFGRIGLRRAFGVDADRPENADRVVFAASSEDPTEAS